MHARPFDSALLPSGVTLGVLLAALLMVPLFLLIFLDGKTRSASADLRPANVTAAPAPLP